MKKVMIIPGHEPKAKGAVHAKLGLTEYDFVKRVCLRMLELEDDDDFDLVYKSRNTYGKLGAEVLAWAPNLAIEVHLNAPAKATDFTTQGTETLYYFDKSVSKKYAQHFNDVLVKRLGFANRGLKPIKDGDRGAPFLYTRGLACILVELFFLNAIPTKEELDALVDKCAKALLDAIYTM